MVIKWFSEYLKESVPNHWWKKIHSGLSHSQQVRRSMLKGDKIKIKVTEENKRNTKTLRIQGSPEGQTGEPKG